MNHSPSWYIPVKNGWRFTFTFPVLYSWHDTWVAVRDENKLPTQFAVRISVRVLFFIVYICGSDFFLCVIECLFMNSAVFTNSVRIYFCSQNPTHLMTHGANYCPRFRRPAQDILLPNNVPKEIVLEVENLPHPQVGHTGFQCIVNIEGAKMMVPARVDNPFIVCDKTTVSISSLSVIRQYFDRTIDNSISSLLVARQH